jgi:outer membrane protein OmpA-like peptidoglycan-associated protein
LKEAESAKEAMSVKNHQLVSELSAAREKISQLETANADLQTANARLKTNIDALAAEKAKLESSLNELAARGDQTAKYVADLNEIRLKNRDRVSREFTLSQGEMGVVLSLPDQLFTVKQPAAIAPQALLKLDLLADYLKALNNPLLIETFGQACGSPAACQSVTDEWAQTLARYLVAQGVPQSRITAVGRGLTGPAPQPQRGRRTTAAAPPLPQVRFTIRNDSPSPSGSQ